MSFSGFSICKRRDRARSISRSCLRLSRWPLTNARGMATSELPRWGGLLTIAAFIVRAVGLMLRLIPALLPPP